MKIKSEIKKIPLTDMQKALLNAGLIKEKKIDKFNKKEKKRREKVKKQKEEKI